MVGYLRPLAGLVMVAAIALRATERRVVEQLEAADATAPERAIALTFVRLRRWVFDRLLRVGAVGETMDQRQYLILPAYAAFRARRRRRAFAVIGLVVALGIAAYWYSSRGQ